MHAKPDVVGKFLYDGDALGYLPVGIEAHELVERHVVLDSYVLPDYVVVLRHLSTPLFALKGFDEGLYLVRKRATNVSRRKRALAHVARRGHRERFIPLGVFSVLSFFPGLI